MGGVRALFPPQHKGCVAVVLAGLAQSADHHGAQVGYPLVDAGVGLAQGDGAVAVQVGGQSVQGHPLPLVVAAAVAQAVGEYAEIGAGCVRQGGGGLILAAGGEDDVAFIRQVGRAGGGGKGADHRAGEGRRAGLLLGFAGTVDHRAAVAAVQDDDLLAGDLLQGIAQGAEALA